MSPSATKSILKKRRHGAMAIRMHFEGNAVNNLDLNLLSINPSSRRRIRFQSFEDTVQIGSLDTRPIQYTRENDSSIGSTSGGRIQTHLQKTTVKDVRLKRRRYARRNSKVGMMFFTQCKKEEKETE
mmetsp:Transcript_7574/g.8734  ORF Transcript_7574/g.8734 Transcript_7574/m.8734 type:complete len:127 (+) Transcript_7574:78-458(+)